MILRRIGFFIALLFGLAATQLPAFVVQYKQALGGAIGELAAAVDAFDSDRAQQNLSRTAAIDRLRANSDKLAQLRGERMQETIQRLDNLRQAQAAFHDAGPVARLGTFVTHYDSRIANSAGREFEPAVPTSAEAFVLGFIGFLVGGGAMHVAARPFRRRRHPPVRHAEPAAT